MAAAKKYFDKSLLPDVLKAYSEKDAQRVFLLTERDTAKVPFLSIRNLSGPYPLRSYKGADLLQAAYDRYNGEDGFIEQLSKQACYWRCDPLHSPTIRYFTVNAKLENLEISRECKAWPYAKENEVKLMQAFQEAENVCILFCQAGVRGFQSWGVMTSRPGPPRLDVKWSELDPLVALGGSFGIEWNESTYIQFRDLPSLYEDQIDIMSLDVQELPTNLGEQAVRALASTIFDDQIKRKLEADREDRRQARIAARERSPPRKSRGSSRRSRSRSPKSKRKSPSPRRSRSPKKTKQENDSKKEGESPASSPTPERKKKSSKKGHKHKHHSRSRSRSNSPDPK